MLRLIGRPYLRQLVVPFAAMLFSVAMLDATVSWTLLRERLAMLDVWSQVTLVTGLALGWSLIAGRALHPVWHQPAVAFLARQPLSGWRLAGYLAPSISIALIPIAGLAWFVPQQSIAALHYASFICLGWPMVLAASFSGRRALLPSTLATLAFAAYLLAYALSPVAPWLSFPVAALLTAFTAARVRFQLVHVNRRVYARLSGATVIAALVRRDLRYLRRRQSRRLAVLAMLSVGCALMMLAFRINGEQQGRAALESAAILLAVASMTNYEMLELLKTALGKELMRRRWPISMQQRCWALLGLTAVLLAPAILSIVVFGYSMGPGSAALFFVYAAVQIALTTMLYCLTLTSRVSTNGFYLLVITLHALALIALPPWWYAALAAISLPPCFLLSERGLVTFTTRTERTSIEQAA